MPKVSIKNSQSASDLKVYETDVKSLADLLVYKTNSKLKAEGNEAFWYIEKFDTFSDLDVYFSDSKATADVLVHFVSDDGSAGWQSEHPLKGKLTKI